MRTWLEIAEQQVSELILRPEYSGLEDDIKTFWQNRTADEPAGGTAAPVLETVVQMGLTSSTETEGIM